MLPILRANEVALLDIQAMTTFEDAPAAAAAGEGGVAVAAPSSEQVAGLREAATAVLAMTEVKKGAVGKLRSSRLNAAAATDDRISRGRLSSITKTVSGVGSGAIGGAKGFRDVQKQKLLDAKERLAQSRDSQAFGELSKEMRLELEAAVAERDAPLEQELLDRYAGIAAEATEPDGPAAQALRWLIACTEQAEQALAKHKAMQLITAMLASESLVLIDLASDSRHVFDALVEYEGAEDPRVPSCRREDDPAELAVGEVTELAGGVVQVLKQAQERVLEERRKRREEAAKAREELKKTAAVEAPKVGIEEGAMLLLLECTLDDERPAPLEAVMGLTSALQNAAVHAEIKKDMISFRADSGAESYGSGSLSDWAKSSAWSSDTGGEKDENGAPIRAQQGIWLEMWESAVKSEGPAEPGEAAAAAAETVLLLRTPESLVHFLNDLMKAGGVNLKVKALHLMKDLYDGQDAAFVGAVRAHSTPFVSELLEYRCAPHPRYGDKPMMRVRKLARLLLEEIHPKLREQRLEEIARRRAQVESAAAAAAASGSPRVLGKKLGLKKKGGSGGTPPAAEAAARGSFDDEAARRARATVLARVMFDALDQDRDGVLLCHEVQELARKTGGSLTEDEYVTVCMQVGSTGREGINQQQLLAVYVDLKMGNIEQDFVLMGLELPDPPAEPETEPEPEPEPEVEAEPEAAAEEAGAGAGEGGAEAAPAPTAEEGEPPEQ